MNKKDKDFKFYLVREDILPEAIKKTINAERYELFMMPYA